MPPLRFPVAVVMQRIPLASRWADERWEAYAVELEDPENTGASTAVEATQSRWRFSGLEIELHPVEAQGYYLNVSAPEPKVFVLWRTADDDAQPKARPLIVTVSYDEAARFLDAGEQVDAVAMPEALRAEMEAFVAMHYRPEPRKKAKRNELYEGEQRLRSRGEERRE